MRLEEAAFNTLLSTPEHRVPTIMSLLGEPDLKDKLLKGHTVGMMTCKVHLDGLRVRLPLRLSPFRAHFPLPACHS